MQFSGLALAWLHKVASTLNTVWQSLVADDIMEWLEDDHYNRSDSDKQKKHCLTRQSAFTCPFVTLYLKHRNKHLFACFTTKTAILTVAVCN